MKYLSLNVIRDICERLLLNTGLFQIPISNTKVSPMPDPNEAIGYGSYARGWWRMPPANVRNNSEIPNSSDSIEKCEACDAQGSFGIIAKESHTCDKKEKSEGTIGVKRVESTPLSVKSEEK